MLADYENTGLTRAPLLIETKKTRNPKSDQTSRNESIIKNPIKVVLLPTHDIITARFNSALVPGFLALLLTFV